MKRITLITGLTLVTTLALAGCTGGTNTEEVGSSTSTDSSTSAPGSPGASEEISAEHNDADIMFAQMMIPHHEQAVQMSEILLAKEDLPTEVADYAQEVIDAQGPEIQRMNTMLEAWGAAPADSMDGMDHGSGMSGMMSEEDLAALEDAEGTEAARLYLEQMTAHHEGAVEMAEQEVEQGQNPEAVDLAEQVIEAQVAEIEYMDTMLREL